eukprot:scaffold22004_cov92-Isochrysis_galbana.AAC.8
MCSAIPSLSTTDERGRRRRGAPKGRHSVPQLVNRENTSGERPRAVSLTDSHGWPVCRSTVCCSRCRSTISICPRYRSTCRPGHGENSKRVSTLPFARRCTTVSTETCCRSAPPPPPPTCACSVSHCSTHGYDLSLDVTSSVTSRCRCASVSAARDAPRTTARPVPATPSAKPAEK